MKKYGFLYLLIIASYCSYAQKRFIPGIKAGIAATQVDGDTYAGYNKPGPVFGATLTANISTKWTTQFEIYYIQKGARHNAKIDEGDYSFYLMRLNYMEVPLLFQYHLKKFVFDVGPSLGFLFSASEFDYGGKFQNQYPFYKTDLCYNLGVGYTLFKKISINWRYSYSILPIRRFPTYTGLWYDRNVQKNNVIMFSLIYQFKNANEEKK